MPSCLLCRKFVLASVALLLLPGCMGGGVDYPEVVSVTGVVLLEGQPIDGATITFAPLTGRASSGKTDAYGRYRLFYKKGMEGAVLGEHRVMIRKSVIDPSFVPSREESEMDAAQKQFLEASGIPLRIGSETSSDPDGSENSGAPLPLKPPLLSVVADRYNGPETLLFAVVDSRDNVFDFAVTRE